MHCISGAWGGTLVYAGTSTLLTVPSNRTTSPYSDHNRKEDSRCLAIWSEWMSRPTPGVFWMQFHREEKASWDGWPFCRTTVARHNLSLGACYRLWISRCGDYWQQAELRTDSACRILMIGKKAIGVTCVNSVIDECKAIGGIDVRQLVLSVGLPVIHNSQSRQTPHCHNNILVMYMFIYYTIVEMYMDHSDM